MDKELLAQKEKKTIKYSTYFKILNFAFIPLILVGAILSNLLIPRTAVLLRHYWTYTLFFLLIIVNIFYIAYCGLKHKILPEFYGLNRVIDLGENNKLGWFFLILGIVLVIIYLVFTIRYFV